MYPKHRHVLIISDIEGSSYCQNYEMTSFMARKWPEACLGMSLDVAALVNALLNAGVESIRIKDFHRTGYNILPEYLPNKVILDQGYKIGPVPGIGDPRPATALMMIGMHAPSGSGGFLAHTLTSRIARLEVNGQLLSEAELFSASLAPFGLIPVFFSGCPVACHHVLSALDGIQCFPINKLADPDQFDADGWRLEMAQQAVQALNASRSEPFHPTGPFNATITMRDGESAANLVARRWGLDREGAQLFIHSETIEQLYQALMQLCYLTPALKKVLPLGISLYNIRGKYGLSWARRQLTRNPPQRNRH